MKRFHCSCTSCSCCCYYYYYYYCYCFYYYYHYCYCFIVILKFLLLFLVLSMLYLYFLVNIMVVFCLHVMCDVNVVARIFFFLPFFFLLMIYILDFIIVIITFILFLSTLLVIGGEFSEWIRAAWSALTHWLWLLIDDTKQLDFDFDLIRRYLVVETFRSKFSYLYHFIITSIYKFL